jgi:hypothetical protein
MISMSGAMIEREKAVIVLVLAWRVSARISPMSSAKRVGER